MTREEIQAALSAPFPADEVKWKPTMVKDSRCLALAYIDARVVMDRLDEVLGVGNWQTKYDIQADGVICRLSLKIEGEWVVHEDFGNWSKQPDGGDQTKAAFSDGLKRAAVHFGVGRYLYRLPQVWVDYDPQKKRIVRPPQLPAWAVPPPPQESAARKQQPAPQPAARPAAQAAKRPDPATGADLVKWLESIEKENPQLFARNQLRDRVHREVAGAHNGTPLVMDSWTPALVKVAVGVAREVGRVRKAEVEEIQEVRGKIASVLEDWGVTWESLKAHHRGSGPESGWSAAEWRETLAAIKKVFAEE